MDNEKGWVLGSSSTIEVKILEKVRRKIGSST